MSNFRFLNDFSTTSRFPPDVSIRVSNQTIDETAKPKLPENLTGKTCSLPSETCQMFHVWETCLNQGYNLIHEQSETTYKVQLIVLLSLQYLCLHFYDFRRWKSATDVIGVGKRRKINSVSVSTTHLQHMHALRTFLCRKVRIRKLNFGNKDNLKNVGYYKKYKISKNTTYKKYVRGKEL